MKWSAKNLHISLDVWNTLLSANPRYARRRSIILADFFDSDPDKMSALYTQTKTNLDNATASMCQAITPHQSIAALIRTIDGATDVDERDIRDIDEQFRVAFAEHPPLWDKHLVNELQSLSQKGVTISIGSNTNFVGGQTMTQVVFDNWDVDFEFKMFSDLEGCVKPSELFFNKMRTMVHPHRQIIHVGDDLVCDIIHLTPTTTSTAIVGCPADTLNVIKHINRQVRHA
jgi:FMN phosphatase YigB (HAD superfamily)